jgi:hypothetical protein
MKKIVLSVTKKHIAAGVRAHPLHCPIAQACTEKNIRFNSVGWSGIYWGKKCMYIFPERVSKWVRSFDLGRPVQPIRFTLQPVKKES